MSRANLKISSILFEMGNNGTLISTVEREPGEDRVAGLMIAMVGPAALISVSDVLVPLLEGHGASSKLFALDCCESAEQIWERMESKGIQWQFMAKAFDYQSRLISQFFLIGDNLCVSAKEALQGALVIPKPDREGVQQ